MTDPTRREILKLSACSWFVGPPLLATPAYQLVDQDIAWISRSIVVMINDRAVLVVDHLTEPRGRRAAECCGPQGWSMLAGSAILASHGRQSYAYLRVRHKNGQMAWTSPVFMNYD